MHPWSCEKFTALYRATAPRKDMGLWGVFEEQKHAVANKSLAFPELA